MPTRPRTGNRPRVGRPRRHGSNRQPRPGTWSAASVPEASSIQLDVTDEHSIAAAVSELQRGPGRLDVLVNTAGIIVEAEPTKTTATELRPVFETNLSAPSR